MELDISMRREVVKETQICNRCLVNKEPVPPGKAHASCRVTHDTKKADDRIRFHACNKEECLESFLLCDSPVHMTKNQVKLNKCKDRWKERDVQFSVNLVQIVSNLSQKKKSSKKKSYIFDDKINQKDEVSEDKSSGEDKVFEESINKEVRIFETTGNNNDEDEYINLKEATEKLRQVVEGSRVIEVPEGEPLFLFSSAVGKAGRLMFSMTRAALTLYSGMECLNMNWCLR